MKRREFLKVSGQAMVGGYVLTNLNLRRAEAATNLPLASLQAVLNPAQAQVLVPTDAKFAAYNVAFNKRTQLTPQVRVVVSHIEAVQATVNWAALNGIKFAIRGGGHSYEGYSQSNSVVIDVRGLNQISVDVVNQQVTVGAGCALGERVHGLGAARVGAAGRVVLSGGRLGVILWAVALACCRDPSAWLVTMLCPWRWSMPKAAHLRSTPARTRIYFGLCVAAATAASAL